GGGGGVGGAPVWVPRVPAGAAEAGVSPSGVGGGFGAGGRWVATATRQACGSHCRSVAVPVARPRSAAVTASHMSLASIPRADDGAMERLVSPAAPPPAAVLRETA